MCDHYVVESRDHLFFHCPFAEIFLGLFLQVFMLIENTSRRNCNGWCSGPRGNHMGHFQTGCRTSDKHHSCSCLGHLEYYRNAYIFRAVPPSFYAYRKHFEEELQRLVLRAKRKSYGSLPDWVQNFR